MPDTNPPLRRDDIDEHGQDQAEARMRQSLERLGVPAREAPSAPGAPPQRRPAARDGEGLVARVPLPGAGNRPVPSPVPVLEQRASEAARDLAAERAAHERVKRKLAEAQAGLSKLQDAVDRTEQARDALLASIAEHEATAAALRSEVREAQARQDAALTAAAEAKRLPKATAMEPAPVKWWLASTKLRQ